MGEIKIESEFTTEGGHIESWTKGDERMKETTEEIKRCRLGR